MNVQRRLDALKYQVVIDLRAAIQRFIVPAETPTSGARRLPVEMSVQPCRVTRTYCNG